MAIEWWVVLATLAGPVIAVQTQKWVEWASENSKRKRWIFYSLMANRATRLNDEYIKALNLIDLEFRPTRLRPGLNEKVISSWRILFGELSNAPADPLDRPLNIAWNIRCNDKLIDLLSAMSAALSFKFSEEELRRGIYYPQGAVDRENAQLAILNGLKEVFAGKAALPMKITEAPAAPEAAELQRQLAERMVSAYDADGALKVRIKSDNSGDAVLLRG
jgi:hypothetical protein